MSLETQSRRRVRVSDVPREKPQVDRIEHANLDRPGAHLHPRARATHLPGTSPSFGSARGSDWRAYAAPARW